MGIGTCVCVCVCVILCEWIELLWQSTIARTACLPFTHSLELWLLSVSRDVTEEKVHPTCTTEQTIQTHPDVPPPTPRNKKREGGGGEKES